MSGFCKSGYILKNVQAKILHKLTEHTLHRKVKFFITQNLDCCFPKIIGSWSNYKCMNVANNPLQKFEEHPETMLFNILLQIFILFIS